MIEILCLITYLLCCFFSYGFAFADFQHVTRSLPEFQKRRYRGDLTLSILLSLAGPLSLFLIFFICSKCGRHGFKIK